MQSLDRARRSVNGWKRNREAWAMSGYGQVYKRWQEDPEGFWAEAAQAIDWIRPWDQVYAKVDGLDRWFVGAQCNTCWNCLDRHVAGGRADQPALIYDSPISGAKATFTYRELLAEVAACAAVLRDLGAEKGDRIVIYMPMVPEAAIAMLACARIGAVHSVVFGGFAPGELAKRIDDARPRLVISASCGLEPGRVVAYKPLLDQAIEMAAARPDACLILQRPQAAQTSRPAATTTGQTSSARRAGAPWTASRSPPPIRSTSSTPRAPPACPRAWCATTAATWWR
jgi:propionyl-CoA synthetase